MGGLIIKRYKEMCHEMYMNSKEVMGIKLLFDWTDEELLAHFEEMYDIRCKKLDKYEEDSLKKYYNPEKRPLYEE